MPSWCFSEKVFRTCPTKMQPLSLLLLFQSYMKMYQSTPRSAAQWFFSLPPLPPPGPDLQSLETFSIKMEAELRKYHQQTKEFGYLTGLAVPGQRSSSMLVPRICEGGFRHYPYPNFDWTAVWPVLYRSLQHLQSTAWEGQKLLPGYPSLKRTYYRQPWSWTTEKVLPRCSLEFNMCQRLNAHWIPSASTYFM